MEQAKKVPKALNILNEDGHAFRLLVGKATFPGAFISLDYFPTCCSYTRQRSETKFKSSIYELPHRRIWISPWKTATRRKLFMDGINGVKYVPVQQTWEDHAEVLLKFCLPQRDSKPQNHIRFIKYSHNKESQSTSPWRTWKKNSHLKLWQEYA